MAMTEGVSNAKLVASLLEELREPATLVLLSDSSAAIAHTFRQGVGRMKHLELKQLWLQNEVQKKKLQVKHLASEINPANLFTKCMTTARFEKLRSLIGICCESQQTEGQEVDMLSSAASPTTGDSIQWETLGFACCDRCGARLVCPVCARPTTTDRAQTSVPRPKERASAASGRAAAAGHGRPQDQRGAPLTFELLLEGGPSRRESRDGLYANWLSRWRATKRPQSSVCFARWPSKRSALLPLPLRWPSTGQSDAAEWQFQAWSAAGS